MKNESFYKQLGQRIHDERERMNLSREKMAESVGVSSKFLYEIENGRKGFSCETFYKICKLLHVDPAFLMEGKNQADKSKIEYMLRNFDRKELMYVTKILEEVCKLKKSFDEK